MGSRSYPRFILNILLIISLLIPMLAGAPEMEVQAGQSINASCPYDLFISEYVEGGSYNKAIEIYNGTGAAVDLGAGDYELFVYTNGASAPYSTIDLTGVLASGDVYVVCNGSIDSSVQSSCDKLTPQTGTASLSHNGDDALALSSNSGLVDVLGEIGYDPGSAWTGGGLSTANRTLRRKSAIVSGDPDGSDDFNVELPLEWDGFAQDTLSGLGSHSGTCSDTPPMVSSHAPTANALNVPAATDISISFDEDVTVSSGWYEIDCTTSGIKSAVETGGPRTFTLNPTGDLAPGESCTVTVENTKVFDQDGTADQMVDDYSWSFTVTNSMACASDLLISEYIEGSSYNKAVEIVNMTGAAVDLGTEGYDLVIYRNGALSPDSPIALSGTLADGDVYVVCHTSAGSTIQSACDLASGSLSFNGNDAVALRKNSTLLDVFGKIGEDPEPEWDAGGDLSTENHTLQRKDTIISGDPDGSDAFEPELSDEWLGYPSDTFTGLGSHSMSCGDQVPRVSSTTPTDGASRAAVSTDIAISFSEDVTVSGSWYQINCDTSGGHSAAVSGGPQDFILNPDTDFSAGEGCTVTVYASQVTDQDGSPDNMAGDEVFSFTTLGSDGCGDPATKIHAIQGSGTSSPMEGNTDIVIEGVVTGVFLGADEMGNFFLQEEDNQVDGSALTSEGIQVYDPGASVNVGDVVRVWGDVTEYYNMTQLHNVSQISACGSGSVMATSINLPLADASYLEPFEGMRVVWPQMLTVSENYDLGRYGQFWLSSGGRLWQPTHSKMPGAEANAVGEANDLNRILVDDGRTGQNPDPLIYPAPGLSAGNPLRSGATLTGLTGVLGYAYSNYQVYPTTTPAFVDANPRSSIPPDVGGSFKVASFNVLNYFNGDGTGGGYPTARGADTASEFDRQRDKIIPAILAMGADIIGLMEIENDGYGSTSAIQDLVDGLNAAAPSGTSYAFVDPGESVIGTDAIAVGLIYRVERAAPVGDAKILDSSVDARFIDTKNRPTLAQTFQQVVTGEKLTVAVNHFKSKGSDCEALGDPDTNDGQGNCNLTRTSAAAALADWLATNPTGDPDGDYLIIGDLNAYRNEDPITTLEGSGYTDLEEDYVGPGAYSYGFKGEWGYLDYALANGSLQLQTTGAASWHINSDEPRALDYNEEYKSVGQVTSFYNADPFRASDHDPVLVGLYPFDFSDLVSSYGTAWHTGGGELRLGTAWDDQPDYADGDDDGTDDGVVLTSADWQAGGTLTLEVTTNGAGYLAAWFDWDDNGQFEGDEKAIAQSISTAGTHSINATAGADLNTGAGKIQARFRLYQSEPTGQMVPFDQNVPNATDGSEDPTGAGTGGEVEDSSFDTLPTAVLIDTFEAQGQIGKIIVQWRPGSAQMIQGYNLHRRAGDGGAEERVNAEMIPALGDVSGMPHLFIDSDIQVGEGYAYRLEVILVDGSAIWLGPINAQGFYGVYLPLMRGMDG